jgi:hypothetical protein
MTDSTDCRIPDQELEAAGTETARVSIRFSTAFNP